MVKVAVAAAVRARSASFMSEFSSEISIGRAGGSS